MADVYLTQRDIDYISRVVATEVPGYLAQSDPAEYGRMVGAVVDTITNRMASGEFPSTVTGVVNQYNQFSAINGPVPGAYGKVQNAPKASQALQSLVASHVADISQGVEESEIGGSLNYANPNFSDAKNLASWVNPMIEAGALKLGIGEDVHYHGIIPGDQAVGPYNLTAEGIPSGDIPVPYGPNDDPFSLSAQAQAVDGFSGLANPVSSREMVAKTELPAAEKDPSEWGVLNGVAPALIPTMNSWAPVAAADPVNAPMDSVMARGFLGAPPSLQASATAKPMMDVAASGLLGANPGLSADAAIRGFLAPSSVTDGFSEVASAGPFGGDYAAPADRFGPQPAMAAPQISQADIDRGLFNVTADGQMDPSFAEGLMGPQNPVVPSAVETTSITPDAMSQDQMASVDNARFQSVTDAAPKTSRIGQLPGLTDMARIDPLTGAINLVANTTGFLEQPAAPADIAGFSDAMAAQRGAPPGLDSAEMQAMRGHVEYAAQKAREDAQLNSFPAQTSALTSNMPAYQSFDPAPGVFGEYDGSRMMQAVEEEQQQATDRALATPMFNQTAINSMPGLANETNPYGIDPMVALNAQPANVGALMAGTEKAVALPSLQAPSVAQQAIDNTVTGSTTSGLLSPTPIASMNPTLTPAFSKGILPIQPINQVGFLNSLPANVDINLSGNIVPAAAEDVVAAPDLETVDVPDQPTIATVTGPATTPAVEQQTTQKTAVSPTSVARTAQTVAQQPSFADRVKSAVNPGTAIGAAIGGGLLGVPGAAIGGFLGNGLYQNTGFLSQPSQPMSINNIGSGYENVTSIWGGGQPVGTQATASDGQTVTAMPGGMTAITNSYGVTTTFDKSGKASGYFGSGLDHDQDQDSPGTNSGGFFGGLFS